MRQPTDVLPSSNCDVNLPGNTCSPDKTEGIIGVVFCQKPIQYPYVSKLNTLSFIKGRNQFSGLFLSSLIKQLCYSISTSCPGINI